MRAEATAKQSIWENRDRPANLSKKFDFSWQGIRQSVELPVTESNSQKAIEPELISAKWSEHGEYHHYGDWK